MLKSMLVQDGVRIAFQEWGASNTAKVIALHGWQDNSNSFNYLGPKLAEEGFHVIGLDHVGHGHSSHMSRDACFYTHRYVSHLRQVQDILGWENPHIVGHSLGAGVGMMYAGCYPERVNKLVLIDGFGPVTKTDNTAALNLRKAIDAEVNSFSNTKKRQYKTVQDVIDARVRVVSSYPGAQYISREAASHLLARGAQLVSNPEDDYSDITDVTAGPIILRNDKKLTLPTHGYFTNAQVSSFSEAITSPSLLIKVLYTIHYTLYKLYYTYYTH